MLRFIERLLRSNPSLNPEPQSLSLTTREMQTKALLEFLIPQLQLLSLQLEQVPRNDFYTSKRSRGYIYGMAAAIWGASPHNKNVDIFEEIVLTAFGLVWGKQSAQPLFDMTLAEHAARDGDTLAGSYRAEDDVGGVFQKKPHAAVMGFWLLNNGHNIPEIIMPTIENPRPLPSTDTFSVEESSNDLEFLIESAWRDASIAMNFYIEFRQKYNLPYSHLMWNDEYALGFCYAVGYVHFSKRYSLLPEFLTELSSWMTSRTGNDSELTRKWFAVLADKNYESGRALRGIKAAILLETWRLKTEFIDGAMEYIVEHERKYKRDFPDSTQFHMDHWLLMDNFVLPLIEMDKIIHPIIEGHFQGI